MTKLVVTAKVKDVSKWEENFRTHQEMFRANGVSSPIYIGSNDDGEVALVEEVADIDALMGTMDSPEMQAALKLDGVIAESVKFFVLNRDFSF